MNDELKIDFRYQNTEPAHTHAYLWGPVMDCLPQRDGLRLFELGCGNGAFARHLKAAGFVVQGVDPSEEAIAWARTADAEQRLEVGSAYENLAHRFGVFPVVVSLEVVEHVYYPRNYAACVADLLEPGGKAIISTPYHGYLKNLALALAGSMDRHFTALWDHGHIKFWSIQTLTRLFMEQGLVREKVLRVGRFPLLAKSMILVFRKSAGAAGR